MALGKPLGASGEPLRHLWDASGSSGIPLRTSGEPSWGLRKDSGEHLEASGTPLGASGRVSGEHLPRCILFAGWTVGGWLAGNVT